MSKQVSDDNSADYIHRKVAVRELISWLIGAMIGLYLGTRVALLVESNLALIIGAAAGWCVAGYICWRISKALFRSEPKFTISARSAKDACFGLVISSLVGGFLSEATETSRLVGAIVGMIAGLVIGGAIGESSTRSTLRKEAEEGTVDNGV